jgi:hypothetical protein
MRRVGGTSPVEFPRVPRSSVDDQLRQLAELRKAEPSDAMRAEVGKALASKSNFIVAKAALVAREKRLRELIPGLIESFNRHLIDPARTDRGCEAKLAIVMALHELDCDDPAPFVAGVRHVQLEPGFGRNDAAAPLRAASAVALARTRYPKVLIAILPLLLDLEPRVRAAAAQAIGAAGRMEGQLLLRLKVLAGDDEGDVILESLSSLLSIEGRDALDFVRKCLEWDDEPRREAAALALGSSRLPGAFEMLREQWQRNSDPRFGSVLLMAIATSRDEAAVEFLLSLIARAPLRDASAAISALKLHARDAQLRERVRSAVEMRAEPKLTQLLQMEFG